MFSEWRSGGGGSSQQPEGVAREARHPLTEPSGPKVPQTSAADAAETPATTAEENTAVRFSHRFSVFTF